MKLIVCVDDKYGMSFNKRRQSKDSILRHDMLNRTQNGKLWMSPYSAGQFEEAEHVCVSEAFLEDAGGEYCFVENADISPYADLVTDVILYRWNRAYPADLKFPVELFADRWMLQSSREFAGSSHDTITCEEYSL